jgi:transposase
MIPGFLVCTASWMAPSSPDLNPIERIWLTMKARWFNNHVCKNEEKLLERLARPYWTLSTTLTEDPTNHRYRNVILTNALY